MTTRIAVTSSPFLVIAMLLLPCSMASAEVTGACLSDAQKMCPGVQAGGGKIRECLKMHIKDLSEPCQTVVLKAVTAKACADDVKKLCAGIEPGEGRVEACMKTHVADVSDACKVSLAHAVAGED
jgi:Cysteine rich repeat